MGELLARLKELVPTKEFEDIRKDAGLDRRTAYYLLELHHTLAPLALDRARLTRLGWTRLQLLAKDLTPDNAEERLTEAEGTTAQGLKDKTRGKSGGKAHAILLYLDPEQYLDFEEALLQHGATRSSGGLANKEQAIMRLIRTNVPGTKRRRTGSKKA